MTQFEAAEAAQEIGLKYSSDEQPGFSRKTSRKSVVYLDTRGQRIDSPSIVRRIENLAIPPAWAKVWICPSPNGYLQATGRDARGRKQRIYHESWMEYRDNTKFSRMAAFGKSLPRIRRTVQRDLGLHGLPKEKVLALVVNLLERLHIRVGNHQYAVENESFGLTTLENRHASISRSGVKFAFKGKSGKFHEIELRDRRLERIVRRCQELPGQTLFEYLDSNGTTREITSSDVNQYIHRVSGGNFTSKDFRTWSATVETVRLVRELEVPTTKAISNVIKQVSKLLGNTPTVCRKSYVHPSALCLDGPPAWVCRPIRHLNKSALDPIERLVLSDVLPERLD